MASVSESKGTDWKTEVGNISVSESTATTTLASTEAEYKDVAAQVNLLVKTPAFKAMLGSLERKQHKLRVDITGNTFKIINTANQACIFDSTTQTAIKPGDEWDTALSKVNAVASQTMQRSLSAKALPLSITPPDSASSRSSSESASPTPKSRTLSTSSESKDDEFHSLPNSPIDTASPSGIPPLTRPELASVPRISYEPHSLTNDNNYCYANSAYQLLGNIPSLAASVLEALPESLSPLRNYSHVLHGKTLIETWNKDALPKEQFRVGPGHMASEFLERLVGKSTAYPAVPFTTVSTRKNPRNIADKEVSHTAPCAFIGLCASDEASSIQFDAALSAGLTTRLDPATVSDEEVVSSRSYFETSPTQLFIKVDRFKSGKKDNRHIVGVPHRLDPSMLVKPGTATQPLELKGFLVHSGNGTGFAGGHYYCCFKKVDPKDPTRYQWYYASDDTLRPISDDTIARILPHASDLYYDNQVTPNKSATTSQKGSSCLIM